MLPGLLSQAEVSRSDLQTWTSSDAIRDEPTIQPLVRT